jgi:hypothetical protein
VITFESAPAPDLFRHVGVIESVVSGSAGRTPADETFLDWHKMERRLGMAMTTSYAMTANDQLAQARRILDTHITSSINGQCLGCGTPGPCYKRENAVVVFSRAVRLSPCPSGAAQPDSVGAWPARTCSGRLRC